VASLNKDGGSKGTPVAHTLVVYVTNIYLANSYINSWVLIAHWLLIFAI